MSNILIVDDDSGVRKGIQLALAKDGHTVVEAKTGPEALNIITQKYFNLVISDLRLPGLDGIALLEQIKSKNPSTIVIMITAYGTFETAMEAGKRGAYDFIDKNFTIEELKFKVNKALENQKIQDENIRLKKDKEYLQDQLERKYHFDNIIGNHPSMKKVFELMEKVIEDGEVTVLIRGESGTGKEIVARTIHYQGPRKDSPFIAVDCASLPASLLESELFGHEKGAFTDARSQKLGKFEIASQGTIFLDEIGDMSIELQAKLLRTLQEREFYRLGGTKPIKFMARVISATGINIEEAITQKKFRQDLYYRLNVISILLPPLREKREDIPSLVNYFLNTLSLDKGRRVTISKEAMNTLQKYSWPGNIRELKNVMEQVFILTDKDNILPEDLPDYITSPKVSLWNYLKSIEEGQDYKTIIKEIEKDLIYQYLEKYDHNISLTAKMIGISREMLHKKLKEYKEQIEK